MKNEKVVLTALTIVNRLISDQEIYIRDHLSDLLINCIRLSTYPESMVSLYITFEPFGEELLTPVLIGFNLFIHFQKIRLVSIQILSAVTKQYTAIYLLSHAQDVVYGLKDALDDRKRLVREAAVLARNQWYLVGVEK